MAHGMVFIPQKTALVGTSVDERVDLARTYHCHPTWLNDDLDKRQLHLPAFWINRSPITNAQYAAFVTATGARAPWLDGVFAQEQANHPVVNVTHAEAAAYAAWAGLRLPSAEEWEAVAHQGGGALYPWGDHWPGPATRPAGAVRPQWDRPGTRPVGQGITSAAEMDDLAGQVCEWTSTARHHHGSAFHQIKGASWFHQDPVNYRAAAGSWVSATFYHPLIGFRCALDSDKQPSETPHLALPDARGATEPLSPWDTAPPERVSVRYASGNVAVQHPHLLPWSRGFVQGPADRSRGFLLSAPALGPWPACLFLAEALLWDDHQLLAGYGGEQPPLQQVAAREGAAYRLEFPQVRVEFVLRPGADYLDIVTTITNLTDAEGLYRSSSCFSLISNPAYYDPEMLRTYQETGDGHVAPLRQLHRRGACIRWIAGSDLSDHGGDPRRGIMAVVARDSQRVFGAVLHGQGAAVDVLGNPWLTCLHTDAPLRVGAWAHRTTLHRLYALESGGVEGLLRRVETDTQRGDLDSDQ